MTIRSLERPRGMQRESGSLSLAKICVGRRNGTFCSTTHILPLSLSGSINPLSYQNQKMVQPLRFGIMPEYFHLRINLNLHMPV